MTDLPNDPAPLTTKGQAVLEAIWSIGGDMALAIGQRRRVPTPDAKGLYALCNVLAEDPSEERLQCLLEEHPGFITGLVGGPDNVDLAVLFKPPVGFQYRADFCVLQAHQGGAVAWLIEIETAHENLFTRVGNPARRLAHALKQIEDWKIWIEREPLPYARELVRLAKTMRALDDHLPGRQGTARRRGSLIAIGTMLGRFASTPSSNLPAERTSASSGTIGSTPIAIERMIDQTSGETV